MEEAGRLCALRPGSGQAAASRAEIHAAEELFGDRLEALYGRLRRLLRAPAPDLAALGVKIELAFEHEVTTLSGTGACIVQIREDARRLLTA